MLLGSSTVVKQLEVTEKASHIFLSLVYTCHYGEFFVLVIFGGLTTLRWRKGYETRIGGIQRDFG